MKYKDYYKTLGIGRNASGDEIKRAYRKLAHKYHPDVSKQADAEARFKEINEANEVLKDPEKRAAYDALGGQWRAGQDFRPPPDGFRSRHDFHFNTDNNGDFSDFFSSIFGGPSGRSGGFRSSRGNDRTLRVKITLEQAYRGATQRLELPADGQPGTGQNVGDTRSLNVRIPAGVTQGQKIRLAGQGQAGAFGGAKGDLYLEVEIRPHALYQLEGKDLILHLPITPWEAALGATIAVQSMGGEINLKIPAGSQSGKRLRVKGRGMPGNPPGDEYILMEIELPPADTEKAKAFYRRMAEELPFNPRARRH